MKNWAINIIKTTDNIVWAFPYFTPKPAYPPYPGFEVLEEWLEKNFPEIEFQRLYMKYGETCLEIKFPTAEEAFMFVLSADVEKS